MRGLSIGKLAQAAEVSIDTIRFYEKSGLLRQPARRPSGFREYSELDLRQLRFVRRARSLGFSIEVIAELLALENEQDIVVAQAVIEQKLLVIDRKIVELQHWRCALRELLQSALHSPDSRSVLDFVEGAAADTHAHVDRQAHEPQLPLRDSNDEA